MARPASARVILRPKAPSDWPAVAEIGAHERLGRFHDGRWRNVVPMEPRSRVAGMK